MDSFEFIPTINKSEESHYQNDHINDFDNGHKNGNTDTSSSNGSKDIVEKRIVSYYLEEYLVERLKQVADENNMYYSTLVNHAIYLWLVSKGYE